MLVCGFNDIRFRSTECLISTGLDPLMAISIIVRTIPLISIAFLTDVAQRM